MWTIGKQSVIEDGETEYRCAMFSEVLLFLTYVNRGYCTGSPSQPAKYTVQLCLYVPDKGNQSTEGHCSAWHCVESCGVGSCAPPPAPHPSQSAPRPSHSMLNLLVVLKRDGHGWSTPRRLARSQIRDQQMPDIVRENCHLVFY
jgi:hypothetical protein